MNENKIMATKICIYDAIYIYSINKGRRKNSSQMNQTITNLQGWQLYRVTHEKWEESKRL